MDAPTPTAPHTIVDARGLACPGPITDLSKAYRRAKVGDVIELLTTDPGVRSDVRAWAAKTQNTILSQEDRDEAIVTVLRIDRR